MQRELREPKTIIERHDLNGRWYAPLGSKDPGLLRPSVTTIENVWDKGIGFEKWLVMNGYEAYKLRDNAARVGTLVHSLIDSLINGEVVETSYDFFDEDGDQIKADYKIQKRLMGFLKFWEEINPLPIASEISLYNEEMDFSGTADLVAEIDGKLWLIDYKTRNQYPTHAIQLTAYKMLWESLYPEKIDYIACLYLSDKWKKKSYTLKKYKFCPEMVRATYEGWQFFTNGKPSVKSELPTKYQIGENNDTSNKVQPKRKGNMQTKVQQTEGVSV